MTAVGKILVFLNLVFSMVVGGFAVVDYAARTHWKDGFEKVKAQNDVLRAAADAYKRDADSLAKEKADLFAKLEAQRVNWDPAGKDDKDTAFRVGERAIAVLNDRARTIEELKTQIDTLRKQLAEEKGKNVNYLAMERAYKTDAERRVADTNILREALKKEQAKSFDLVKEANQARDEMVAAQIAAKTLKDRNTQLESQVQELARNLAQAKATLGASSGMLAKGVNPPPENVEGLVRRAEGNLVTISLGSDAGLAKGQTMEVFRLGANARYIGRIRLVEVEAKQAVGQLTGRATSPIQVGDRVASRILGGS